MKRTTLMAVPALAIALGGCSEGPSTPASSGTDPTSTEVADTGTGAKAGPGTSTTTSPSSTSTTPSDSGSLTSATPATTAATTLPTSFTAVDKTIKDPDLGHEVVVTKIARDLPWPAGYKASAEAYELVAVEMTWTPGTTYTAPLRLQDFSVNTGSQFPNRPETLVNEALKQAGWPLLPDQLPNGQTATGWVVFKVDPKDAPKMTLDYTRPKSQLVDSDKVFPSQVFSAPLVG